MTDYKLIVTSNHEGQLEIRYRQTKDTHWQTIEVDPSLTQDELIAGIVNTVGVDSITRKLARAI